MPRPTPRIFPQRINDAATREELAKLRALPAEVAYLLKLIQPGPDPEQAEATETRDPDASAYQRLSNQTPVARTGPRVPLRDLAERISSAWAFLAGISVTGDGSFTGNITAADATFTTVETTGNVTLGGAIIPAVSGSEALDENGLFTHIVAAVISSTVLHPATMPRVLVCGGAGGYSVTLPSVSTVLGRIVTVKNRSSGAITVDGFGSQTIDGSTTSVLASSGNAVTIVAYSSSADHWLKLSEI